MFYSQDKQDEILEKGLFKGYKNGFYVDVGAHNGRSLNNTLFFEETHGWNGINIEPNKTVYDKLVINRPNNINLNCAVCNTNGEAKFLMNKGYTEMLSGLEETFDPRHINRIERENIKYTGTTELITVKTKTMETILDEYNIKTINYLSIDVEGAEFEVIKSINFEKVFIDVIGFENNYPDVSKDIINYLRNKGFKVFLVRQDIFVINQDSTFVKNLKAVKD